MHATVEDDGVGMPLGAESSKGYGLFSIRECIDHVGGGMQVESTRGKGTVIRLWAPIADGGTAAPEVRR